MIHERVILTRCYADVAELADAPDLGSGVPDVQVQVLLSAPNLKASQLRQLRGFFIALSYKIKCTKGQYHDTTTTLPRQKQ